MNLSTLRLSTHNKTEEGLSTDGLFIFSFEQREKLFGTNEKSFNNEEVILYDDCALRSDGCGVRKL